MRPEAEKQVQRLQDVVSAIRKKQDELNGAERKEMRKELLNLCDDVRSDVLKIVENKSSFDKKQMIILEQQKKSAIESAKVAKIVNSVKSEMLNLVKSLETLPHMEEFEDTMRGVVSKVENMLIALEQIPNEGMIEKDRNDNVTSVIEVYDGFKLVTQFVRTKNGDLRWTTERKEL